jgi:ubiquinol-cytochrome c reductase cytochrome c subunit
MRRARLAVLTLALGLVGAPAARADQPPIVRPIGSQGGSDIQRGAALYAANCATCHGSRGQGVAPGSHPHGADNVEGTGPPLLGVGARAADFYLRTGYMPLGHPDDQPTRSRQRLHPDEVRALTKYVASLGGGPPVPPGGPGTGSVSRGLELFTEHCAGCHQVVAEGGIVTGAKVPPLDLATPRQIREAVRIGPYVMPTFSTKAISDHELEDIVAYVQYAKQPQDAGGWGINHLGPFPEGLVTWGIAIVVLIGGCVMIGTRLRGMGPSGGGGEEAS